MTAAFDADVGILQSVSLYVGLSGCGIRGLHQSFICRSAFETF
jgi:hypothetical protein